MVKKIDHCPTGHWSVGQRLVSNKSHVKEAVEGNTGLIGVIKWSHGSWFDQRFRDEATHMSELTGRPGILPVLDLDACGLPGAPHWYVMPRAQLLGEALGDDATLHDVVGHTASIADVLAALTQEGILHRDIKPDNLFFWDGRAVLGDFGIAAWTTEPGKTRVNEKVGPAYFIAPEMREKRPTDRGRKADVYSLAKTLFVLALPSRGKYPPDGTHYAEAGEFSMWESGGGSAITELREVLEAATEFDVSARLSMSEFRDELREWWNKNREVKFRSRVLPRPTLQHGWDALSGSLRRTRRNDEITKQQMYPCMRRISMALTGDADAWDELLGDEPVAQMLNDYHFEPNSEEGFMPDGIIQMATAEHGGLRLLVGAVQVEYAVCFIGEAHLGPRRWTLEQSWGPTEWCRSRMPRAGGAVESMAVEIADWIEQTIK